MAGQALTLKFGTDFADAQKSLGALAQNAGQNLRIIATEAIRASSTLRNEVTKAAADASVAIVKQTATINNLKLAVNVTSEALKTGLALNHPALAVGIQLLNRYKLALGAVGLAAVASYEAAKLALGSFESAKHVVEASQSIGVSATLFQVWTQQAEKTTLSVKEMEDALKTATAAVRPTFDQAGNQQISGFMRLSDELQNGKGFPTQSYQMFKDAGDNMDKLVQAATQLVSDLQKAGDQFGDMRLKALAVQTAMELWGSSGRQIAEALEKGQISISDLKTRADELGTGFSDKLTTQIEATNRHLKEASEHLDREMKPSSEWLARNVDFMREMWAQIVGKTADVVHNINQMVVAQKAMAHLVDGAGLDMGHGVFGVGANRPGRPGSPDFAGHPEPVARPSLSALAGGPSYAGAKGGGSGAEIDQVANFIKTLEKQNAALAGEAAAIGKSNVEREKSIDLFRADEAAKERGIPLTEKEKTDVLALAEAHATLKQKIDDAAKAKQAEQAQQQYFADSAFNAVDGLIAKHQKLRDVLSDLAKSFEQAALKSLLLGQGPLSGLFGMAGKDGNVGGLFGSLFGMFSSRADGGVAGGPPYALASIASFAGAPRFADGGGIPSILHPGEIVLNAAQQKNVAGAMGAPSVVVHNHAAGVQVEPYVTRGELQLHVTGQINAFARNLPGVIDERNKRGV